VIPVLWRAQEQNDGWVSRAAMEEVGKMLDMPYIRVYEIATFYTMFQLEPVGKKAHVQVCGTTPCMLRGSEELMKVCKRKIAEQPHTLSADGNFLGRGRVPGRLRERADDSDLEGHLRGPDAGALEDLLDKIAKVQGQAGSADRPHQFRTRRRPHHADRRCDRQSRRKKVAKSKPASKAAKKAVKVPPANAAEDRSRKLQSRRRPSSRQPKKPCKGCGCEEGRAKAKPAGPERLTKPKGKADDLKLISGVGPKLEGTLNKLGFWHFKPRLPSGRRRISPSSMTNCRSRAASSATTG
jgi:NADH-quinone oxidoreductase subunit E